MSSLIHENCIFSVCRCVSSAFFSLSVFTIQVFSLEMVCRCVASAFSLLSVLAIQGFLPGKVCRCMMHGLLPLFMFAIQVFSLEMVCRCIASVFFSFCQLRHMVLRPKWCVGEGAKDIGQIVNDAGRRVMNDE